MGYDSCETMWTRQRGEILKGLKDLTSPTPSQLYQRAIDEIGSYSSKSNTAVADFAVISHCVREFMNSLPEFLGDVAGPRSNYGNEQNAAGELRNVLLDKCDNSTFSVSDNSKIVAIPSDVARAIGRYRREVKTGNANKRRRASLAVLGRIEIDHPAVSPWIRSHGFFNRHAHVSRSTEVELPTRETIMGELSVIENVLISRLGLFFEVKAGLKGVLEAANAQDKDGNYIKPTQADVDSALSRIANPTLRFIFYSELVNPKWLSVLKDCGAFRCEEEPDDQSGTYPAWPEAIYLKRLTKISPELVIDIILDVTKTPNPVVRGESIGIALELPLENAVVLSKEVVGWAEDGFWSNGYFWARDEVLDLIRRLLLSDCNDANAVGKRLLQECFMPKRGGGVFSDITSLVPRYCYSEKMTELEDAVEALPLSVRKGMFNQFSTKLLFERSDGRKSSLCLSSIEHEVDNRTGSISGEVVFQLLRAVKLDLENDCEAAVKWLKKKEDNPLLVRCALYESRSIFEKCFEQGAVADGALGEYARKILLSDAILDDEFDPELYPLFGAAWRLGIVSSEEIDAHVQESTREWLERYRAKLGPVDSRGLADSEKRARRWRHRALCLIGSECLGEDGRKVFDELSSEFPGAKYRAAHDFETETLTGPNSPMTSDEMLGMGPEALLDHLLAWHPSQNDRFRLVSHEGQGRELKRAIEDEPFVLSGWMRKVLDLRPTYQRAVLEGWGEAVSSGKDIPIGDAVLILSAASKKPEEVLCETDGDAFDDDPSYLNLRREAARFAKKLLDSEHTMSEDESAQVLDALLSLARSSEPDASYECEFGGDNEDPQTLSMNTVRPIAMLSLAKWVSRNAGYPKVFEVLRLLEEHLPDKSSFRSEAAAMGEALPYLRDAAPDWLRDHYAELFGGNDANPCQQIVLTTALALFSPKEGLYRFLSPAMLSALDDRAESYELGFRSTGRDCLSLIGRWAYICYAKGVIPPDDPVLVSWRQHADGNHLGSVLSSICGDLREGQEVPQGIAERIGELWDYHNSDLVERVGASALLGMVSLARSGCFEASWWGPRLLRELKVNGHEVPIFFIKDGLEVISTENSDLALDIPTLVIKNDPYPVAARYYSIGLRMLEMAKKVGKGALSESAKKCMDALGEIGCTDLDERLGL